MPTLDLFIILAYVAGTVLFGAWFSRQQHNVNDYFVGGRNVPWWAIMASIVATETSTVTFISVPGFAYAGNFTFLQLVIGYMIGRVAVTLLFIPAYFRGDLLTVYQLLGTRFGDRVKRLAASLFLATRSLADGFRLFATGLVLAALLMSMPGMEQAARSTMPGIDPRFSLLAASVLLLGAATIVYTYLGGMKAVIWTDLVQLAVYLGGAVVAAAILIHRIPGGLGEAIEVGTAAGRFQLFDFTWDLGRSYTFWSGVIGGAFLTTATHGTDQMMVQRYLCSRTSGQARAALLLSGLIVFVQFALFLFIGVLLFVYYTQYAPGETAAFSLAGRLQTDRVFPHFVVTHMPAGLMGLVVAAIFAAAMSTLSSSLNSSAATSTADFYIPLTGGARSDGHYLRTSRIFTAGWGLVQIGVALLAIRLSSRVVDEVLGIASFTNGVILGVFLLGTLTRRVGQGAAFTGMIAGASLMLAVRFFTPVSWQWYVLIGSLTTFSAGLAASYLPGAKPGPDAPVAPSTLPQRGFGDTP
jgi:solute:Na+ symporter, SSS family